MTSTYNVIEPPCTLGFCRKGFWDGSGTGPDWEVGNGKAEGGPRLSSGLLKGGFVWTEGQVHPQGGGDECRRRGLAWYTTVLYKA